MKNLIYIILTISLLLSTTAFANETTEAVETKEQVGKKSVMDELTNDSAFEYTEELFDQTTNDNTSSDGSLLYGIAVVPVVVVESVIWILVAPFNAIGMAFDDDETEE